MTASVNPQWESNYTVPQICPNAHHFLALTAYPRIMCSVCTSEEDVWDGAYWYKVYKTAELTADTDGAVGVYAGTLTFGPNQVGDEVDESVVSGYALYKGTYEGVRIGDRVAYVAKLSESDSRCCKSDTYVVDLAGIDVAGAETLLLVVVDINSVAMPTGVMLAVTDFTSTSTTTSSSTMTKTTTTATTTLSTKTITTTTTASSTAPVQWTATGGFEVGFANTDQAAASIADPMFVTSMRAGVCSTIGITDEDCTEGNVVLEIAIKTSRRLRGSQNFAVVDDEEDDPRRLNATSADATVVVTYTITLTTASGVSQDTVETTMAAAKADTTAFQTTLETAMTNAGIAADTYTIAGVTVSDVVVATQTTTSTAAPANATETTVKRGVTGGAHRRMACGMGTFVALVVGVISSIGA